MKIKATMARTINTITPRTMNIPLPPRFFSAGGINPLEDPREEGLTGGGVGVGSGLGAPTGGVPASTGFCIIGGGGTSTFSVPIIGGVAGFWLTGF